MARKHITAADVTAGIERGATMRVDKVLNESGDLKSLKIADGNDALTMEIQRHRWGPHGYLKTADGNQTWWHASLGEINLLILHAERAVTVAELIEDLGECDEVRLANMA